MTDANELWRINFLIGIPDRSCSMTAVVHYAAVKSPITGTETMRTLFAGSTPARTSHRLPVWVLTRQMQCRSSMLEMLQVTGIPASVPSYAYGLNYPPTRGWPGWCRYLNSHRYLNGVTNTSSNGGRRENALSKDRALDQ